jgi:hypothetical protein
MSSVKNKTQNLQGVCTLQDTDSYIDLSNKLYQDNSSTASRISPASSKRKYLISRRLVSEGYQQRAVKAFNFAVRYLMETLDFF